ncbi:MAG TPA: hypothetical protein PKA41_00025 [Verrucomicrobiota bacterium]|nr:hypothetical protein [Verrucomicrobiota bacterium]
MKEKIAPAPLDLNRTVRKHPISRMPAKNNARKSITRQQQRDLDVKIKFMEGIVRRDPEYVDALQLLGDHYTQRGRFSEGLDVDEKLSRLEPGNPLVFYNLACSYSLTSQFESAVESLERALTLGYRDFTWMAKDPDLSALRKHPLYRRIRAKVRSLKVRIG